MPSLIKANVDITSGWVQLKFGYDPPTAALIKVPGARWDKPNLCWWLPVHGWEALKARGTVKYSETYAPVRNATLPDPFPTKLRGFQVEAANFLITRQRALLSMEQRTGKAQPLDAQILTPTGWRRMGDLKIDDPVIDPDGGLARIEGIFPQGIKPVYRVTTADGAVMECCGDHLFTVQSRNQRSKHRGNWQTRPLHEICRAGLKIPNQRNQRQWYLPIVVPPTFDGSSTLPLAPYLMGALLGNGCFQPDGVSISTGDAWLIGEVMRLMGDQVKLRKKLGNSYDWRFSGTEHGHNQILSIIRDLGLEGIGSPEKFIPRGYLAASPDDRLALLRGLMDTDGDTPEGVRTTTCIFNTTSTKLRDQVRELVGSLGGFASVSVKKEPKYAYRGETRIGLDCWRLYIRIGVNPFATPRKAEKWRAGTLARGIDSVEPIGEKPVQCIKVSSARGLYVTDGYIVTHNTPATLGALEALFQSGQVDSAVILYPGSVRENWREQIRRWTGRYLIALQGFDPLPSADIDYLRKWGQLILGCHYEILDKHVGEDIPLEPPSKEGYAEDGSIIYSPAVPAHFEPGDIDRVMDGRRYIVIADEVHACKNRKSGRYRALKVLSSGDGCVGVWGLTGTPQRNYPRDLYGVFDAIQPGSMGGYGAYAGMKPGGHSGYCGAKLTDLGYWDDKGESNAEELSARLAAFSYRKTRLEVAKALPKSQREVIMCELTGDLARQYRLIEGNLAKQIKGALSDADPSGAEREALKALALCTSQGKIPTAVDRALAHAEGRGVKCLVFAHHHEVLRNLEEAFRTRYQADADAEERIHTPTCGYGKQSKPTEPCMCGRVPYFVAGGWLTLADKHRAIEEWKRVAGPAILLANTLSVMTGIDLSDADTAIFLELEWVPADFAQAHDRIMDMHLGKRVTPALYEYLLCRNTVDADIGAALLLKMKSIGRIVGGDSSSEDLSSALRKTGMQDETRLGLANTDAATVQAAVLALRSRLLGNAGKEAGANEKDAMAAALLADWDDDPSDVTEEQSQEAP